MIVSVKKAVELIQTGNIVGLPTETVYGLAADALNVVTVQKIFDLKRRPPDNPLIVHVSDLKQAETLADTDFEDVRRLTEAFWPGPLTLVLPKKPQVLDIITAGLDTVAIRMPNHSKTLSVIEHSGPLAAPSANRSGRPSPTRPEHVEDDFGAEFPVVDGGSCTIGIESTVLDLSTGTPTILRPGKITAKQIEEIIKREIRDNPEGELQSQRSPGTRYTHYKPKAAVRWMSKQDYDAPYAKEKFYMFHTSSPDLSRSNVITYEGDFESLARSLYDHYRTADKKKYSEILIEPFTSDHSNALIPALQNRIDRSVSQ